MKIKDCETQPARIQSVLNWIDKTAIQPHQFLFKLLLFVFVSVFIGFLVNHPHPDKAFVEGTFFTFFSGLLLLLCAAINLRHYYLVRDENGFSYTNPGLIWLLIGLGFIFLCLDECLLLHEKLDQNIHLLFGAIENSYTDHLDDIFVMSYIFFGALVLYYFKENLKPYSATAPGFMISFLLIFVMVFLDFITNNPQPGGWLDISIINIPLHQWLAAAEDIIKLLAEWSLLATFFSCLKISFLLKENS